MLARSLAPSLPVIEQRRKLISPLVSTGTTTFRLRANGITILHDTWLEKPALAKRHLELDDVKVCDYIVISHAHFDQ